MLSELTPLVGGHQAVIYKTETNEQGETSLHLLSVYADSPGGHPRTLRIGQGLVGQCAADSRQILISDMPKTVHPIASGLFQAAPQSIIVLPVLFEGQVKAVIELASLSHFTELQIAFLEQLTASIGIVLNSIEATMQTENLLEQSQKLAGELQTQQDELQTSNEQLEQKAAQLAERNFEVERKNQEIEQARRAVEEKASELALTSRYKSEFLANMSHELRTPLNSILILGQQLADNPEGNLAPKQVEFARTIHGAGTDLLNLISDILDLSKIESGTVTVDAEEIFFSNVLETVARPFRHQAESQRLSFEVQVDSNLGRSIVTDSKRLQQILKNLLSNALKFTAQGSVRLRVVPSQTGWRPDNVTLNQASSVVAFEVTDTGVGIPVEKQKIVFEAFQQADASTSRKYGGTGLGLAISRELAMLLGGELTLRSTPGLGSTFTLFLPTLYTGPRTALRQPAPGALPLPPVALPDHLADQFPDDRHSIEPHDRVLLIVEDDPNYAGILVDAAHCVGAEGRGDDARCGGARPRPAIRSGRHVARHLPARHAGLERAQPVQAHAGDAPYPSADPQHGRGPPAGPVARRLLLPQQADDQRRAERGARPHQRLCAAAQEAAADRRGQRGRALRRQRTAGPSRPRDRHRRFGPRRARAAAHGALRLHGARPAPARPLGLRGAGGDAARRGAGRPAGRGLHRPRPVGRGGRQAAHHGALDRGEGGGLARAAVRRDRPLPSTRSPATCPQRRGR